MSRKVEWTLENIKSGFERFYDIHGRYPNAYDVDDFDFLPSARQIQRRFGGLVNLRAKLGLEIKSYSCGKERSDKVSFFNKRGIKCENAMLDVLRKHFDEKFIHIEKPTNKEGTDSYDSKDRYDFYVYAKPNDFAIDVFATDDIRRLIKIMNIKEKKYRRISSDADLYFVYCGEGVDGSKLIEWLKNRRTELPSKWMIVDSDNFENELKNYSSYRAV